MTRGKGIYDDEEGSTASRAKREAEEEGKHREDTPDVDKDADEPTA